MFRSENKTKKWIMSPCHPKIILESIHSNHKVEICCNIINEPDYLTHEWMFENDQTQTQEPGVHTIEAKYQRDNHELNWICTLIFNYVQFANGE